MELPVCVASFNMVPYFQVYNLQVCSAIYALILTVRSFLAVGHEIG